MDFNAVATELERRAGTTGPLTSGRKIVPFDIVPDALPDAAFVVGEVDITFDKTFGRGSDEATITCRVFVARADDAYGQRALREFMAGGGVVSIKQALETKPRYVPGVFDDLQVKRARGNRLFIIGEQRYYGVEFDVYVIGDGS